MKKVKSKYYLRISFMLVCLIMISGCGKKEPEKIAIEEILQSEDLIVDPNTGTQSEGEETVEVKIYFSNKTAENLESELVSLDQLSPEKLIAQLAKKNIVSLDTKVNSFQVYDKDNKVVVDLNLSKEFRDYISLMGTSGEYIIIASLTNTFLEAYKGDVLVLNVAGTTLETGHNRYDQPIERFPITNQEMALHYKIESFEEDEGIRKLRYPQLIDMEDEEFMNRWNEIIRSEAMGNFTLNGMSSFEVDYEIKTQDIDMISILLKGSCYYENAAYPLCR